VRTTRGGANDSRTREAVTSEAANQQDWVQSKKHGPPVADAVTDEKKVLGVKRRKKLFARNGLRYTTGRDYY